MIIHIILLISYNHEANMSDVITYKTEGGRKKKEMQMRAESFAFGSDLECW